MGDHHINKMGVMWINYIIENKKINYITQESYYTTVIENKHNTYYIITSIDVYPRLV